MSQTEVYSLGRIGLKIRGAYSPIMNYEALDVVRLNGSSYVATAPSVGMTPDENPGYWSLLAQGCAETSFAAMPRDVSSGCLAVQSLENGIAEVPFRYPVRFRRRPIVMSCFHADAGDLKCVGVGKVGTEYACLRFQTADAAKASLNWMANGNFAPEAYDWDYQTPYCSDEEELNEQGVFIEAGSEEDGYPAWRIMDGCLLSDHCYQAVIDDAGVHLDIAFPHKLMNMVVLMGNDEALSEGEGVYPAAGQFLGSNDAVTWTALGGFDGRDSQGAFAVTQHRLENAVPYSRLRIQLAKADTSAALRLGDVRIRGTMVNE